MKRKRKKPNYKPSFHPEYDEGDYNSIDRPKKEKIDIVFFYIFAVVIVIMIIAFLKK